MRAKESGVSTLTAPQAPGWLSIRRDLPLILASIIFTAAIAAGFVFLWRHERTPGAQVATPVAWPAESSLAREPGRTRILLFAHPFCPCVRATLSELERLLASRGEGSSAHVTVVFHCPNSRPESWMASETWRRASRIPGVDVRADESGDETRRFGALTSGMIVAYDALGRLQYAGGITGSRGHEGDNAGADSLASVIASQPPASRNCSVFGCRILSPLPVPSGNSNQP